MMEGIWRTACADFDAAVAGMADEETARAAFRQMARTAIQAQTAAPDEAIVRDCMRFVRPLNTAEEGMNRVIYFPTRPGQLPEFFNRLIFYVLYARMSGHNGPVAWLSFPVILLAVENRSEFNALVAAIDRSCRGMEFSKKHSEAVSITFEPDDRAGATLHLGAQRPTTWNSGAVSGFARTHGLPITCIPSRTEPELKTTVVPWGRDG